MDYVLLTDWRRGGARLASVWQRCRRPITEITICHVTSPDKVKPYVPCIKYTTAPNTEMTPSCLSGSLPSITIGKTEKSPLVAYERMLSPDTSQKPHYYLLMDSKWIIDESWTPPLYASVVVVPYAFIVGNVRAEGHAILRPAAHPPIKVAGRYCIVFHHRPACAPTKFCSILERAVVLRLGSTTKQQNQTAV